MSYAVEEPREKALCAWVGAVASGLAGLVLTQGLMVLWVEALRLHPGLAKIPTAGIVFVFNFTVRRALLFKAPASLGGVDAVEP